MANKQGQPGPIGNKKQAGQGNQGQEDSKAGVKGNPQVAAGNKQRQPGSQKDRNGKIGQ